MERETNENEEEEEQQQQQQVYLTEKRERKQATGWKNGRKSQSAQTVSDKLMNVCIINWHA